MSKAVRIRVAQSDNALNLHKAVCIGVFVGADSLAREAFGANRVADARRLVRRLRAQGQNAVARWVNVGPWCAELWTQDLMRPLGMQPERFHGALVEIGETTGVHARPTSGTK